MPHWSEIGARGLGHLFKKGACGLRVAHRGLLVEPEHLGEVERIGPVGQGLFEFPVDAEPLQCRVLPAHRGGLIQWLLARLVLVAVWLLISR